MEFELKENFDGASSGKVELLDRVFAQTVNQNSIYELMKNQQINKRQGNASSKNIAMMSSRTTKKPWRQKGTGNARAGTRKSPLWVGGAVTFGPQKRDFSYRIPKKIKKSGIFSLLSGRVVDGTLHVLGNVELAEFKTKKMVELFRPLLKGSSRRLVWVIFSKENNYEFIKKSTDNLIWLKVINVESIEAGDLFYADQVVFSKSAIEFVNKSYGSK